MPTQLQSIIDAVNQYGLAYRGHFAATQMDKRVLAKAWTHTSIVMVGNIGSAFWPHFACSTEFQDGQSNALDRWSMRIASEVVAPLGGVVLNPSSPRRYPFMQWAKRAHPVAQSKMQLLIDEEYGLWHAYRFALALPFSIASSQSRLAKPLCQNCPDVACLSACPVNAYSEAGFDYPACTRYLTEHPQSKCAQGYCQARMACPVGTHYRYNSQHAMFHMQAFKNNIIHIS